MSKKTLVNWLPAIVWMLAIFVLSATPADTLNNAGLGSDPIHIDGHFALFLILCITYYKATKSVLKSLILTIIFAFTDEFHQRFTPGRSSSMFDIYIDTIGALISVLLLWKLQVILPKKLKNWLNK